MSEPFDWIGMSFDKLKEEAEPFRRIDLEPDKNEESVGDDQELGISVVCDRGVLKILFLFSEGAMDGDARYKRYRWPLPADIKFSMTNLEIETRLGAPVFSRGVWYSLLGLILPMARYNVDGFVIDIRYNADLSGIQRVAIYRSEIGIN